MQDVFCEDDDIHTKQTKLQELFRRSELDVSMVSGTFEELPLECDDGERDIFLQVWHAEIEKLVADANEDVNECIETEELDESVSQVLTSYVKARFAALAAEAACSEEGADSEEERAKNETKKRKGSELDATWTAVVKHHRLIKMQARLHNVSNKKQKTTTNADTPMLNDTPQQTEPEELQIGGQNQNEGTHIGVNNVEDHNIVSVKDLLEGMLSKQTIRVKIFYVPVGINRVPRQYGPKKYLDIFQTVVGCSGEEYNIVAFHRNAIPTLRLMRDCAGCVVEMAPVKHNYFKGTNQIEVQDNLEIKVLSTNFESLRQQILHTITMSMAANLKDKSRAHFTPVKVKDRNNLKHDKNGKPYRSGRYVDASGFVSDVIFWGIIATKEELFVEGGTLELRNVTVNRDSRKFELKETSAASLAPEKTFEVPRRLQMVEW